MSNCFPRKDSIFDWNCGSGRKGQWRLRIASGICPFMFYFVKFFYNHMTSQICFFSILFQLNCVSDVVFTLMAVFFLFFRVIKFLSHVTYLTLKYDFLSLKLPFLL